MFKLIGDSTSDLPRKFFEEHQVDCIDFSYEIDGKCTGMERIWIPVSSTL